MYLPVDPCFPQSLTNSGCCSNYCCCCYSPSFTIYSLLQAKSSDFCELQVFLICQLVIIKCNSQNRLIQRFISGKVCNALSAVSDTQQTFNILCLIWNSRSVCLATCGERIRLIIRLTWFQAPLPFDGSEQPFGFILCYLRASLVAQLVKSLPAMQETRVQSLDWEDPLEKEMAIRFNILVWKIPWTEEPGGLQSMRWQRVRQTEHAHMHICTL